jgi:hypothetical protein
MKPRELDLPFFEATLIPPLRLLPEADRPDVFLDDYLRDCQHAYHLSPSDHGFILLRLYLSGDGHFAHIIYAYGPPPGCRLLVIVVNYPAATILGHHFLDLPDSPDEHSCPVPNNPQPPPHLHRPEAKEIPER